MPPPKKKISDRFSAAFGGNVDELEEFLKSPEAAAKLPTEANPIDAMSPDRGQSMLYIAARFNHVDFVKRLIEAGALINLKNSGSPCSTPLHGACYGGNVEVVKVLVEAGALKTVKNDEGETPLDNAKNPADTVSKAVQRKVVTALENTKPKPAPKATSSSKRARAGPEEDAAEPVAFHSATSATTAAAVSGSADGAESTVAANGAAVNGKTTQGKEDDQTDDAAKKAKAGIDGAGKGGIMPDPTPEGSPDRTAAVTAVQAGDLTTFRKLLPSLNHHDKLALLLAISWANKAKAAAKKAFPVVIDEIFQSGFDITQTDAGYNKHPVHLNWECPELLTKLLGYGLRSPKDIHNDLDYVHYKVLYDHPLNMMAYLTYMKQDINDSMKYGQAPVVYAARVNSHKCLKALIAAGANVNKGTKNDCALLQAVRQFDKWSARKEELVKILLDAGADPSWTDSEGKNLIQLVRPKNATVIGMLNDAMMAKKKA